MGWIATHPWHHKHTLYCTTPKIKELQGMSQLMPHTPRPCCDSLGYILESGLEKLQRVFKEEWD